MSDALARIRVTETHGIRRFLYPLTATVDVTLPPEDHPDLQAFSRSLLLTTTDGQGVPMQAAFRRSPVVRPRFRLDFALSLPPLSETLLELHSGRESVPIPDPLQLSQGPQGELQSTQERFAISLSDDGAVQSVVYDGVPHLNGPSRITRGGAAATMVSGILSPIQDRLSARVEATGRYPDGCPARTISEITACKSWAVVTHQLERAGEEETVEFTLPFALTSPTPIYDLGNAIYGKLTGGMTWETRLDAMGEIHWSVANGGRTDYMGMTETKEQWLAQRWCHLVDRDKALAVAVTQVPPACRDLAISISAEGHVLVVFHLEENTDADPTFGVCYHFLNDIPAIAAATNPQSILLPPTVEVLPAH